MGKIKEFTTGGDPVRILKILVLVLERHKLLYGTGLPEEVQEAREWLERIGTLNPEEKLNNR